MSDRDYRSYGILEQEILDNEQEFQYKQRVKASSDIEHIHTQQQNYDVMSLDQTESPKEARDDKVHHFTKPSDSQHILLRKIFHKRKTDPDDNPNGTDSMEAFISQDRTDRMNVSMNQGEPEDINISVSKDKAEVISSSINKSESENINASMRQNECEDMDSLTDEDKLENIGLSRDQNETEGTSKLLYQKENNNEHIQHATPKYTGAQIYHTDLEQNMSFDSFVRKNPLQGKNSFMKWTIRILTACVFLMLSPVIIIVLGGVGMVLAAVAVTTLVCIGLGLFILIGSCFIATQISMSLFMLGIFISIALISFGGILSTIVIIFIKWCIGGLRKQRASRKSRHQREA